MKIVSTYAGQIGAIHTQIITKPATCHTHIYGFEAYIPVGCGVITVVGQEVVVELPEDV